MTIWQKKKLPDPGKINAEQISQFAKENGSFEDRQPEATDPNFISNLIVSSLLYEFLQKQPPSSETPAVLYWLARIERKMDRSAFYSFSPATLRAGIALLAVIVIAALILNQTLVTTVSASELLKNADDARKHSPELIHTHLCIMLLTINLSVTNKTLQQLGLL